MADYDDVLEKIGDTALVGKGKNLKSTTEGRRNYSQQNPLANSTYTSNLWCFIPKKCLSLPKIIIELKKLWVKGNK